MWENLVAVSELDPVEPGPAASATSLSLVVAGRTRDPLDTVALIETPEHVRFAVRVAGPARRALAYVVDLLIRGFVVLLLLLLLGLFEAAGDFAEASSGMMLLALFAVEWGYYMLLETLMNGQTPGKKALGLRTVKEGGYPITFIDVVLRNLVRAADWLPVGYVTGLVVMGLDRRFRRLGDMVAGTMVIAEQRSRVGTAIRIGPPPTEQELLAIPARPGLEGADLEALELYLRRVGTLSPARESELAEIVAPMYARRLGLRYQHPGRFLALLYHRAIAPMVSEHRR